MSNSIYIEHSIRGFDAFSLVNGLLALSYNNGFSWGLKGAPVSLFLIPKTLHKPLSQKPYIVNGE